MKTKTRLKTKKNAKKRPVSVVKALRERKKLSQMEFAKELGVSQGFLSKLENGETQITMTLAKKLHTKYKVPASKLIA